VTRVSVSQLSVLYSNNIRGIAVLVGRAAVLMTMQVVWHVLQYCRASTSWHSDQMVLQSKDKDILDWWPLKWTRYDPLKYRYLLVHWYGITSQKVCSMNSWTKDSLPSWTSQNWATDDDTPAATEAVKVATLLLRVNLAELTQPREISLTDSLHGSILINY